jgi:secreted trypsin-like serine protease
VDWNDRSRAVLGSKLWVHPTYRAGNSLNAQDVAVIEIGANWTLSSSLGVVELASNTNCGSCESPGTNYFVSGYGLTSSTSSGGSGLSDTLLFVTQQNVDTGTCLARLQVTAGPTAGLTVGAVCAGPIGSTGGKDSCQGDSGGPLTFDRGVGISPRYLQVGIVSYGTAQVNPLCGGNGDFGVYVRKAFFVVMVPVGTGLFHF